MGRKVRSMAYKVESLSHCSKKLSFHYDSIDLSPDIQKGLKLKQQKANLKGFRPGKAPMSMIETLFRGEVENEVQRNFVSKEFFDAVEKEALKTVGFPMFSSVTFEANSEVKFEVTVEVFPEFELQNITQLNVTENPVVVTEEEFVQAKEQALKAHAQMIEIEDASVAVEKGHFVVINFVGHFEDGSEVPGAKANESLLEIGSGRFIPGFEDHLVGMKKDEAREFTVTFPADYHAEDLRSKNVCFKVTLLEIKEHQIPTYNDDFAKELEYDSVADYEKAIRENLQERKSAAERERVNQQIIDQILKMHSFDIPQSMIALQEDNIKKELKGNLKRQQFTDQMVEEYFVKWHDDVHQKAIIQIRTSLILDKIAESYQIEATDEDLEKKYAEFAERIRSTVEDVKKMYASHENIVSNLRYAIQEEKTLSKILELNRA